MSELGNRLKSAREEKNLSLNDLQETTKIQKRYLVGIEEGNYKVMPGKFYVRAFIKQYAEAVGLDPEMIFEEYKNEVPDTHQDALPEQLSRVQSRKELPETASKALDILPKIVIILIIIAVAVIIWVWRQNSTETETDKASAPAQNISSDIKVNSSAKKDDAKPSVKPAAEKPAAKEPAKPEPKQSIKVTKKLKTSATYEISGTDKLAIEMKASGSSWVSIKDQNGKTVFQGTLKKGKTISQDLSGNKSAVLRVGSTPVTQIKLNGQPLKYGIKANTQTLKLAVKP
ncbi:DUF4115 domain-containing protein [Metabacillus sp. GX 13764]|uniref:helix-turn-helix domain-containing protein n=1 Tax=Metabacillus kandeliae TaxID=2900151 RepID=UPI001E58200F|nr:RodZ domain-containing protein [Metabacillus kandeliae]MCD7033707.1 DUF4115 domain-containing protein [Metabacillus kandeliae]